MALLQESPSWKRAEDLAFRAKQGQNDDNYVVLGIRCVHAIGLDSSRSFSGSLGCLLASHFISYKEDNLTKVSQQNPSAKNSLNWNVFLNGWQEHQPCFHRSFPKKYLSYIFISDPANRFCLPRFNPCFGVFS